MQVRSPPPPPIYHSHPPPTQSSHSYHSSGNGSYQHQPSVNGQPNGQTMQSHSHHEHAHTSHDYRPYPTGPLPSLIPNMGGPTPLPAASQSVQAPPAQYGGGPSTQQPERRLSFSGSDGRYTYELVVEQQPVRARMCGFGDKDRRPITPPPCIRLIIRDRKTGQEADFNEIEGNFFVLQVDLWCQDAEREVNIVRASSTSPAVSISTATTTSFPPPPERPMVNEYGQPMAVYHDVNGAHYYQPAPPQGPYTPAMQQMGASGQPSYPGAYGMNSYGAPGFPPGAQVPLGYMPTNNANMFTRNLIGSLSVNASRLTDVDGKIGYWFVLQDLSIRTEGFFRLKMNFIDVGAGVGMPGTTKGKAPVLAWVFSDKFQVFSAKKFPGVIESTPLSKCFAGQGIKIPIRKDGPKAEATKDEDDD